MAHTPITGYRELSADELAKINRVKALAIEVGALVDEFANSGPDADQRWVSIARTDLQTGFMALNRAIAKPTTF